MVAAMTMPTLIANHRAKELNTRLNTAYALLSQAIDKMYADGELLPIEDYKVKEFKESLKKHFVKSRDCGSYDCLIFPKDDAYRNYTKTDVLQYTNLFDDGQFYLANGMLIAIQNEGGNLLYISVDINGKMNKPNILGHDLFMFQLVQNGDRSKLVPMGTSGTALEGDSYCSLSDTSYSNGLSCAYKALNNLEYFKNLQ